MVWSQPHNLLGSLVWPGRLDPRRELGRIQSEMSRLFGPLLRAATEGEYPPVRVWTGDEGSKLVALLPGVDPESIELTVTGDTLSLRGGRELEQPAEGTVWHRRERRMGRFARNVTLPFEIDAEHVEASFRGGVLEVSLPRVASQKPRRIQVATS